MYAGCKKSRDLNAGSSLSPQDCSATREESLRRGVSTYEYDTWLRKLAQGTNLLVYLSVL